MLTDKEKLDYLYDLGLSRFKKKAEKLEQRLKEISYIKALQAKEPNVKYELDEKFYNKKFTTEELNDPDVWHQLIYESVFEALGYSKNKEIMQKLSAAADIRYLKNFLNNGDFRHLAEAALFNISGMMPDVYNLPDEETSSYTKKLAETWSEIKNRYDGKVFSDTQWHFYKLRPQNFPTIRLAGGVRLLERILKDNLILKIIKTMESTSDPKKLERDLRTMIIVKGDGFWKNHYVFDQPAKMPINYFIGVARADEILINVILPILSIYFDIFDKKALGQKVLKLYNHYYQKSENTLVNEVATNLALHDAWKRSILYQGMIELFRTYCARSRCLECRIGTQIFN